MEVKVYFLIGVCTFKCTSTRCEHTRHSYTLYVNVYTYGLFMYVDQIHRYTNVWMYARTCTYVCHQHIHVSSQYARTHTYIYISMHACVYIYIYVHLFAVSFVCTLEQVFWALVHVQVCMLHRCFFDTNIHICEHTRCRLCTCVYMSICVYMHVYQMDAYVRQ